MRDATVKNDSGIHATFMYNQVLGEAPWIDAIVRGEGEEIIVNLVRIEGIAHEGRDRTLLRVADRRDPVPSRREDWPQLRARLLALRPGNLPPE